MRHHGPEGFAALVLRGEGSVGAPHAQVAVAGENARRRIAQQDAGEGWSASLAGRFAWRRGAGSVAGRTFHAFGTMAGCWPGEDWRP
jgi:hypothetical protein